MSEQSQPTDTQVGRLYVCSSCQTSMRLQPDEPRRCPNCLRASGLVAQEEAQETSSSTTTSKGWIWLLVLASVGVLVFAIFFMTSNKETGTGSKTQEASSPKTATSSGLKEDDPLEKVPIELRIEPDTVDGAVLLVADELPRDVQGIIDAVSKSWRTGALPSRVEDMPMDGAPRKAGLLAAGISGAEVPAAGSLELVFLAGALIKGRGLGDITYGIDSTAPHSATDISKRRYLLRMEGGAWLAPDGLPVKPEAVVVLSKSTLLANTLSVYALGALASDDQDLASRASQQARVLASEDAAVLFTAGQIQFLVGLGEMGLATMERAAQLKSDAKTWFNLGVISASASQNFKAYQYLQRAAKEDPASTDPHILMAQLSLERIQTTPSAQHQKLLEEVKEHLGRAEAIDSKGIGIRTIKSQVMALEGDLNMAETLLREEIGLRPSEPGPRIDLVRFLEATEREQEAMEVLQKAIDDDGLTGGELHQLYGAYLVRNGQLFQAEKAFQRAYELQPGLQNLRLQLAQLKKASGQVEQARGLLLEHIDKGFGKTQGQLLLVQLEMDDKQYGAAATQLEAVIKLEPSHKEALLLNFILALHRGEGIKEARQLAIGALENRSAVAQVLLEQGMHHEGEKLLRDALIEEPEDATAPVMLAGLLVATGRQDEANTVRADIMEKVDDEENRKLMDSLFDAAFSQAREYLDASKAAVPAPQDP